MKRFYQTVALLLALLLLAGCAGPVTSPTEPSATAPTSAPPAAKGPYSVTVTTRGGMALPGIDVYVYADEGMTDLIGSGATNEEGTASMELPKGGDYFIELGGLPKGYEAEESYRFTGNAAAITLTSSLIEGENLSGASLGVGDVMYDFTVTTPANEKVTLSEMLAEKKMVVLNFWYTTCTYCVAEFPFMQQAYDKYAEDVGIIALNPGMDDATAISLFQSQHGLTFPMAECPAAWSATFGISGYPTTVVVDLYGVICLVEAGGITSLRPWECMFDHFTAQDYDQTLYAALSELVTTVKPTFTMPTQPEIEAVLGTSGATFRPETKPGDADFAWPFIVTEKNGEACMKASNQSIESSYAILYADVPLKAGQAVAFDYLASSEKGSDVLYVIVDGEDVFQISGVDETEKWSTCYPWVAAEDGVYEIALCYMKDGDTNEGDDTVYIKDLRIVEESSIDTPTYIPMLAGTTEDGLNYTYPEIVFSEADGYYHVGTADGPLLLANLMGYSAFNEEKTVWDLVYEGIANRDGKNFYDDMVDYFSYASNSQIYGMCPVNEELKDWLRIVDDTAGFVPEDENEWLRICTYYQSYGTDVELEDPIKGLAEFSAYTATEGVGIESNAFSYNRPIMPRGLLAKFVPERSGVYRITSRSDSEHGCEGWIFREGRTAHYTYEPCERLVQDTLNVDMVYYMEAGEIYYIDIAFWDIYEINTLYYDIVYIGPEYEMFRLGSPAFYTYDSNATGDDMYHLIAGGVDVVLGEDGIYYEDLGKDENGIQRYGSPLYADFVGITGLFDKPLATVGNVTGIIDLGGFDFSKTENDMYILNILAKFDGDTAAADEYLKGYWAADYEGNAAEYQLEDIFAGIYHGRGEDYTDEIRAYLDDLIDDGHEERKGCVIVTEELAELLQLLVDKYTFAGVDHSWTKLCYYYDHLGPEA